MRTTYLIVTSALVGLLQGCDSNNAVPGRDPKQAETCADCGKCLQP